MYALKISRFASALLVFCLLAMPHFGCKKDEHAVPEKAPLTTLQHGNGPTFHITSGGLSVENAKSTYALKHQFVSSRTSETDSIITYLQNLVPAWDEASEITVNDTIPVLVVPINGFGGSLQNMVRVMFFKDTLGNMDSRLLVLAAATNSTTPIYASNFTGYLVQINWDASITDSYYIENGLFTDLLELEGAISFRDGIARIRTITVYLDGGNGENPVINTSTVGISGGSGSGSSGSGGSSGGSGGGGSGSPIPKPLDGIDGLSNFLEQDDLYRQALTDLARAFKQQYSITGSLGPIITALNNFIVAHTELSPDEIRDLVLGPVNNMPPELQVVLVNSYQFLNSIEKQFLIDNRQQIGPISDYLQETNNSNDAKDAVELHIELLMTDSEYNTRNDNANHPEIGSQEWANTLKFLELPNATTEEVVLAVAFPTVALKIYRNKNIAYIYRDQRMSAYNTPATPTHVYNINDIANSFLHCFYVAINTRDVGTTMAKAFSDAHESETPAALILEKQMDLHNNTKGLTIGQTAVSSGTSSNEEIANSVETYVDFGLLLYLSPLNFDFSPLYSIGSNGIIPETQLTGTH